MEYFDFEGVIPRGGYGAGDVIVWDWAPTRRCIPTRNWVEKVSRAIGDTLPGWDALDDGRLKPYKLPDL